MAVVVRTVGGTSTITRMSSQRLLDASHGLIEVMDTNEVAAYLKVHPASIYRLRNQDGLPAVKLGGSTRFLLSSVREWALARQRSKDVPAQPAKVVRRPGRTRL